MGQDFAEVWGSVEALRAAVAAGYIRPGRDEQTTLALGAEIDRLRAELIAVLRIAKAWNLFLVTNMDGSPSQTALRLLAAERVAHGSAMQ